MTREEGRKAWITALRSGKYMQGKDLLHNITKQEWCCLGVACDIVAREIGLERWNDDGSEDFNGNCSTLPQKAVEFLGLRNEFGGSAICDTASNLTKLNDTGVSFNEIADLLESGKYWRENG